MILILLEAVLSEAFPSRFWCRLGGHYLGLLIVLERGPSGHDHRGAFPWAFSGHPTRRTVMDCLALEQGLEDAATKFIGPVKKREMPRYIVRVNGI
ncbi:hypothetical protein [Arthrobacter sp. D1-17]